MSTGFERAEAEALFRRLTSEIKTAEAERSRLTNSIKGMVSIVSGLEQLYPDITQSSGQRVAEKTRPSKDTQTTGETQETLENFSDEFPETPVVEDDNAADTRPAGLTSVEIAAKVVHEITESGGAVSVPTVYEEMKRRGWLPKAADPLAAVRTALSRAKQAGLVVAVPLDGRSNGYKPAPTSTSGSTEVEPEGDVTATGQGGDSLAPVDQDHGHDLAGRNRDDRGGASVAEVPYGTVPTSA